jgi:hypothetical protein
MMTRHRCNPSERLFCLINELRDGEGMISSGIRLRGIVDDQRLQDALKRLQARHEKLRCRLEFDNKRWPWFVEMDPIQPIACEFRDIADPSEAEPVLLHAWPGVFPIQQGPPVQLIVLKCAAENSTDIVGWFHHTVFDGPAVWLFFEELLEAYADPQACHEPAPGGFGVLPNRPRQFWADLKWFFTLLWFRAVVGRFHAPKTFQRRPITGTAYIRRILSPEMTRRIVEKCRRERVTVTSALSAAGCHAIADEFSWHGELIAMPTPRDVRADLKPTVEPGTLGCFATIYEVVLRLPAKSENFWDIARRYTHEAKFQFEWKDPIRGLRLIDLIPVRAILRAGTQRGALIVNNLGRVSTAGSPQLPELLDYYGYGRTKKMGGSALTLTASTTNDRMSVALATGCFDQAMIERLFEKVVEQLDRATQPAVPEARLEPWQNGLPSRQSSLESPAFQS